MTGLPDVWVEYAGGESIAAPVDDGWTWTDMTSSVRVQDGPSWSRGRGDERSTVGPGRASFNLDYASTWAPDSSGAVRIGTPVRLRQMVTSGNLVTNSTIESASTGWSGYGTPTPTVARSTAQHWQGSASLLVTWGTGSTATQNALYKVTGLVVGRQYTVSAYVYVPAGKPAVKVGIWFLAASAASSTTGAWERLSVTFTATLPSLYVNVSNAASATSGDTCYVDGIMLEPGSAVSTFTASAPVMAPLFSGFVGGLQSAWVNGVHQVVRVTCTDVMTWLARQSTSAPAAASAGIQSLAPVAWWPCDDGAGALTLRQAGSSALIGALAVSHVSTSGGTVATRVDGLPALVLDPADYARGYAASVTGGTVSCSTDRTYAIHFSVTRRPAASTVAHLVSFLDVTNATWLTAWVDDGGRLQLQATLTDTLVTWGPWPDVADGRWHHLALVVDQIGAGTTCGITVYLDGQATVTDRGWSASSPAVDTMSGLSAVSVSSGSVGMWAGKVAHVAVYDAKLSAAQVRTAAGPLCSAGLDAGAAITALLAPTGVVPTLTGTFAATLGALGDTGSMLTAVTAAAAAERGIVHALPAGGLEVQARSVRRSPASAITLLGTDVASDLAPQSDEADVVNDVTVTGVGQLSARRVSETSVLAYGRRQQSVSLPLTSVADCDDHAAWLVTVSSDPSVRIGAVTVAATAKAATVDTATLLGLDLSDEITLSGLPGTPSSMTLFVEGIAGRLSLQGMDITLNVSPVRSPDLIDYAAQGTLIGRWDARYPAGTSTTVADATLLKTWTDLSTGARDATNPNSVNLLDSRLATFEDAPDAYTWPGIWWDQLGGYPAWSSYSRTNAQHHDGSYSGRATWAVASRAYLTGVGIWPYDAAKVCYGLVPGAPYTVSAWVYVDPGYAVPVVVGSSFADHGSASVTNAWERIYWHGYANTPTIGHGTYSQGGTLGIGILPAADGYGICYIDSVMVEEGHVTPGTFTTADPTTLRAALRYGNPGSSPMVDMSLAGHVMPLSSALTDTAPCTLYLVLRPDALDRYVLSSSASSVFLGLITSGSKAKWRLRYLADGDAALSDEITSPVGQVCVLTVQIGAGGAVTFRHNGTAVGGQTDAGILGLSIDRIGGTGAGDTWDGGVGCVLAYGDAHSAATVSAVEKALALMWGVTLA